MRLAAAQADLACLAGPRAGGRRRLSPAGLGVTGWILQIGWKSCGCSSSPARGPRPALGAPLMVCGLIQSEPRYGDTLLLLPAAGSVWALSVLPAERPQLGLLAGLALLGALLARRVPE